MFTDYKNKVVAVTGAGNGIGKALALGCAKRGAKLLVNDIHGERPKTLPPKSAHWGLRRLQSRLTSP